MNSAILLYGNSLQSICNLNLGDAAQNLKKRKCRKYFVPFARNILTSVELLLLLHANMFIIVRSIDDDKEHCVIEIRMKTWHYM